ncbi:hypothetical protein BGW39_007021 [Mortierella sp. 14UC]|nr:hypothetical protein BGW39_007021 [Mortierella sp. 14UC]
MKLTTAAILVLCAPSLAFDLVGNDWKFDRATPAGLSDITFPFNMANAPHRSGYYFALQPNFRNVSKVAYTGLQPHEDSKGNNIFHATGTTTKDPNCRTGADSGPGVSCAIDIKGSYWHNYNLVVENTRDTTWRGGLVDTRTGVSTVVGEWTLPKGSGKIVNGQLGFVEYYTWSGLSSHTCDLLPYTRAIFYNPTSKARGASGGKVTEVYEYGDCVGKVDYSVVRKFWRYNIKVGFKKRA